MSQKGISRRFCNVLKPNTLCFQMNPHENLFPDPQTVFLILSISVPLLVRLNGKGRDGRGPESAALAVLHWRLEGEGVQGSGGPCTACGHPDRQPYAAAALLAKATCRGTTLQLAMAGRLTGHGFKLSFILEKIATTSNFK